MHLIFSESSLLPLGASLPELPATSLVLGEIGDYRAKLFEAESQELSEMGEARQMSFSSGRHYAHQALLAIGCDAASIGRQQRAPVWPAGTVGSISHSRDLAAAMVSSSAFGIGVDVEHAGRVDRRLLNALFTDAEQSLYADNLALATVAFSAKEAGYKSIYPSAGSFIGFKEAEIQWLPDHRFSIRYLGENSANERLNTGIGYWREHEQHILTTFILSR